LNRKIFFVAVSVISTKKEKPEMSNMMKFQTLLNASSENQNPYLKMLIALTKVGPAQLVSMTSGLGWQPW